jgi:hypothetical protein
MKLHLARGTSWSLGKTCVLILQAGVLVQDDLDQDAAHEPADDVDGCADSSASFHAAFVHVLLSPGAPSHAFQMYDLPGMRHCTGALYTL